MTASLAYVARVRKENAEKSHFSGRFNLANSAIIYCNYTEDALYYPRRRYFFGFILCGGRTLSLTFSETCNKEKLAPLTVYYYDVYNQISLRKC